jgi:GT2 family glycosyltransferase
MSISIVIPSYQRPTQLRACLQALRAQSRLPEEVLVVARPSDGPTCDVVREEWMPLPVRLLLVHEHSIIAAETLGVTSAQGALIGFIDDDAIPAPEWCQRVVSWHSDPEVGAVGGPVLAPQGGPRSATAGEICRVRPWGEVIDGTHELVAQAREVDHLRGCNMSVRRTMIALDPAFSGYCYRWELDLCLRVRRAGLRVIYDPNIYVTHHQPGRLETPREIYCRQRNNTYVLLKHLSASRRLAFLLFTLLWGDTGSPGMGQYLGWLVKHRRLHLLTRALLPGMAGKLAGCRIFLAGRASRAGLSLRDRPRRHTPCAASACAPGNSNKKERNG